MSQISHPGTGKYEEILIRCKSLPPVPTAVAYPCESSALTGAIEAAQLGLILPLLVGPAEKIREIGRQAKLDLAGYEIIDVPGSSGHASAESAARAVELVREGRAEILMK